MLRLLNGFRAFVLSLIVLFNGGILYLLIQALINQQNPNRYLLALALTVGIMGLLIFLALSPWGESFFRVTQGMRRLFPDEEAKIRPLFNEVCARAGEDPNKYELFLAPGDYVNVFAFGRKTIAFTRPMLNYASDEELKAAMSHELAHLKYGDTKLMLVAVVANAVGTIAAWVITILTFLFGLMTASSEEEGGTVSGIGVIFIVLAWIFKFCAWLLTKILDISFMVVGRAQEYRCDEFSARLGYRDGLVSFLNRTMNYSQPTHGVGAMLMIHHPAPGARIDRLMRM